MLLLTAEIVISALDGSVKRLLDRRRHVGDASSRRVINYDILQSTVHKSFVTQQTSRSTLLMVANFFNSINNIRK